VIGGGKLNKVFGNLPKNELTSILLTFRKTFIIVALFSYVINMLMLAPAIYMLQIYDRVLSSRNMETLLMVTIMVVFMYIVLASLEWVRSSILIRAGNRMDEMMSSRTFTASFANALNIGSGNASQSFNDLVSVRQFFTGNGLFAFFDAPWAPIYIIVIFMLHPALGILAVISGLLIIFLTFLTEILSKKVLSEANQHHRKATTFAGANFRNAEVIEAMGMLDGVKRYWMPRHLKFMSLQTTASERAAVISSITKFIRISSQSLVYAVGAYYVIKLEMTAGAMIAGSILMGRALAPIEMIMGTWKQFIAARESYAKLGQLFMQYPEHKEKMSLPRPKGRVKLDGLYASPPNSKQFILKNVSFVTEPGDMVAVIGPSGSGKSTLSRILVGVWNPALGSISLDSAELYKWNKKDLGTYIGYLPQDVELLDGTIAENIARFEEYTSESVIRAAMLAGVHEMILATPEGYDTFIGEGGVVLSGGQRQRIALARAIYGDPVLLVLDEPNSNLDDAGEKHLLESLVKLKSMGKTIFVVTHKTSVLSVVDKIAMLKEGVLHLYGGRNEVLQALQKNTQPQPAAVPQPPQAAPVSKPAGPVRNDIKPSQPAGAVTIRSGGSNEL